MELPARLRGWATPLVVLPAAVVAGLPATLLPAAPGVLSFAPGAYPLGSGSADPGTTDAGPRGPRRTIFDAGGPTGQP